jgi:hypothetical protein
LHDSRGSVSFSVVLDKDSKGLIVSIFADEPTRAFREETVTD